MSTLLIGDATGYPGPEGGGTKSEVIDGYLEVYKFVAAHTGTIDTLSAWVRGESDYTSLDLCVYADSSGVPGDLLGYGSAPNPSVASADSAWVDATVSIPIVAGTVYWVGWQAHGGAAWYNLHSGPYFGFDSPTAEGATPPSAFPYDPTQNFDGVTPGLQGLGTAGVVATPAGLEFHVTGLWYPAATDVTYYGRVADPADGSNTTIPLNDSRLGEVTLSLWDPVVVDLVHHAYARMLKVYYNGSLEFWGPVKLNDIDGEAMTCKASAVDPSIRAIRHYLRRGDIGGDLSAPHDDKSSVTIDGTGMREILDAARNIPDQIARGCPDIGIYTGVDTATARADHLLGVARGDGVWDDIAQLSSSSLGPDFKLQPTESRTGYYCDLITADRIGQDRTATVQLHYGTGFNNLDGLSFNEGSEYVTHAHVLSRDGRRVTAVDVESSAETGQYTYWDATDLDAQGLDPAKVDAALAAMGEAIIDAYGRPLVVITLKMPLDSEDGYLFGRDYDIGDTISVAAKLGLIELEEAPYRITQVKLAKEGDGVRPEIQVVPSRVEAKGDTVNTSEDS